MNRKSKTANRPFCSRFKGYIDIFIINKIVDDHKVKGFIWKDKIKDIRDILYFDII